MALPVPGPLRSASTDLLALSGNEVYLRIAALARYGAPPLLVSMPPYGVELTASGEAFEK